MLRTVRLVGLALFMVVAPSARAQDNSCVQPGEPVIVIDGVMLGHQCVPLVFHFQVIAAVNSAVHDPAIADVDTVLHRLFKFAGYQMVAHGDATAAENKQFEMTMRGKGDDGYHVTASPAALRGSCVLLSSDRPLYVIDGVIVAPVSDAPAKEVPGEPAYFVNGVTVAPVGDAPVQELSVQVQLGRFSVARGDNDAERPLLSSGITLPIGRTVVLGGADAGGKSPAMILAVRVEYAEPGCPRFTGNATDIKSILDSLSRDNIKSIEMLKGERARATFGNQAANGVVLVTTKSGAALKPWQPALTFRAQAPAQGVTPPLPARPSDVESADAITAALYDVISGPAGQKRDWDRFRSLFIPGGRLIPARMGPDGKATTRVLTADEYANQGGGGPARNSFYEREVSRKIDAFGSIMQRFSTYESRHEAADEKPFARGINSIQLFNDGTRWWVVTVLWDSERPGNEIPEQYLTKPPRRLNP